MQKNGSTTIEAKIDNLKENVRNLVDAGGERAGQLKDRAKGMKDSVVESSEAYFNRLTDLIKAHPIAALGIAFGIGYIAIRSLRK
jgi:ElaB/YqjD/DUF883 family membrane-anchored ribosome-binding protein